MKKKKKSIDYGKWGYIFILPFFVTYIIFSLIPLIDTVRYSFFEYYRSGIKEVGPNFIGMANYVSLLHSDMLKYGANTLILWVIGFVLYRMLMKVDLPVGNTLPDMVITMVLCLIWGKISKKK